jgi:hypothetical protein
MKRMQERIDGLGKKRYVIGVIVLAAITLFFMNLNLLPI